MENVSLSLTLIWLALLIFMYAALWKVFTKAGKPGWAAIVPVYNAYIMLKIGGKPGWWLVLFLIPVLNIIVIIWMLNMISKSFGKDENFTVGMILMSIIFLPILGFGSARYRGPYGDPVKCTEYENEEDNNFEFEYHSLIQPA